MILIANSASETTVYVYLESYALYNFCGSPVKLKNRFWTSSVTLEQMLTFLESINESETLVRRHLTSLSGTVQQYHDKIHKTVSKNNANLIKILAKKVSFETSAESISAG